MSLSTPTHAGEPFVQLDLCFVVQGNVTHPYVEQETLDLARYFITACHQRKWGRYRKQYLTRDRKSSSLFGSMDDIYTETLACVLHCGPDWVSDVCQRYSVSRWKVDLRGAYELLLALQNTHGRWPVEAWNERSAAFLVDFINFLIVRGLPRRQISQSEYWRPLWVRTDSGGKVITFAPVQDHGVSAAVPVALLNPEYVHLARLWLLTARSTPERLTTHTTTSIPATMEWTLLGKSVLFSDELAIDGMTASNHDRVAQQLRVFGRSWSRGNIG